MDPILGEINIFPSDHCPSKWVECMGQKLKIADYDELSKLLKTTFGGDGITTFGLPDLRCALLFDSKLKYCIALHGIYPEKE
jgi:microcystin-dependent protein